MDNSDENTYQKAENEMKNYLKTLTYPDDAIQERIEKFMKKYIIKPYYIYHYLTLEIKKKYREKFLFHFNFEVYYYSDPMRYYKFYIQQRNDYRTDLDRIYTNDLEYFIFPHSDLNRFYCRANWRIHSYLEILERIFPEPLSKALIEKWNKAVSLYQKLKELKDDDEKWVKCLHEWDDEEFMIYSIEYKISQNLYNKALWKLYIEFWRPKNPKIMIGIYSRYCCFFLDDLEMKAEYKKEAEKLGIVLDDDKMLLDYKEFRSLPPPTLPAQIKYFLPKTNFNTGFCQALHFHNSFINYLMDNCKPEVLLKLFKSCKYFFKKRPTPICHRLVIAKDQRSEEPNEYFKQPENPDPFIFDKQALTIAHDHDSLKYLKKLYLTNCLHIAESFDNGLFKKILPKIYQSKIKYLTIENHSIELNEYIFLTKSETVKRLVFHNSKIINSDGSFACLENLMETLPNANFIDLRNNMICGRQCSSVVTINAKSFKKISLMSRNTKMYFFGLGGCNIEAFNANDFFDFMKANIIIENKYSNFIVHFGKHENSIDILKSIVDTLTDLIKAFDIPRECYSTFESWDPNLAIFPFRE